LPLRELAERLPLVPGPPGEIDGRVQDEEPNKLEPLRRRGSYRTGQQGPGPPDREKRDTPTQELGEKTHGPQLAAAALDREIDEGGGRLRSRPPGAAAVPEA